MWRLAAIISDLERLSGRDTTVTSTPCAPSRATASVKMPSPDARTTESKRSATRSLSITSRSARSAPFAPDRHKWRARRHSQRTLGAAWWLQATMTWSVGPTCSAAYASWCHRTSAGEGLGEPVRFSMSMRWSDRSCFFLVMCHCLVYFLFCVKLSRSLWS